MMRNSLHICFGLLCAAVLLGAASGFSAGLTPAEQRGKRIYLEGKGGSDIEIKALLRGNEVSATLLPCGSCHGPQGIGSPQALGASDIRHATLSRVTQQPNNPSRTHTPYTDKTLKRAITMGLDPAGNPLHPTMPKYQLSLTDMGDLIAYLRKLGQPETDAP